MRTLSSSFCKAITILPGIRTKQYENGNLGCTHEGFKLQAQCQKITCSRTTAPCLSGSRRFCRMQGAALGQTRSHDVCQLRRSWPAVPFDTFTFSKNCHCVYSWHCAARSQFHLSVYWCTLHIETVPSCLSAPPSPHCKFPSPQASFTFTFIYINLSDFMDLYKI